MMIVAHNENHHRHHHQVWVYVLIGEYKILINLALILFNGPAFGGRNSDLTYQRDKSQDKCDLWEAWTLGPGMSSKQER